MLFGDPSLLRQEAARLDAEIAATAERARSEEDFRIGTVSALRDLGNRAGLALDLRAEMAIASGRADAAYNRVVIEFERPGVMRGNLGHGPTNHAVQQVKDYLAALSTQLGVALDDLAGVATDGYWYVFVRSVADAWVVDGPLARNPTTTGRFLRQVLSLGTGRALTARNLVEDFGTTSLAAGEAVSALYRALFGTSPGSGLRDALYEEWARLFGAISGVSTTDLDDRGRQPLAQIAHRAGLVDPEPARLLFAVHTYFAIVTKLVAFAAVGRTAAPIGVGIGEWAGLEDTALRSRVRDLERGGLFRQLGLRNFLEGDFFGWYVPCWTSAIADAIRSISAALSEYDPGSLEARPELTRDLLKGLYQYLLPRQIRHDLGEYYTPDWLAEFALDEAEFTGDYGQRLLDPACGSGTFLVLAIARIRQRAQENHEYERATLTRILDDVVGFDLNPLAVIAARANYVLALGDLLAHRSVDVDIPIYLADSVNPPAAAPGLFDAGVYPVRLSVEEFTLPSWVHTQQAMESLAETLDEAVNSRVPTGVFMERVEALAPGPQSATDRQAVESTFHRLAELHETGRDGVWARILKNAFMPLFVGRFSHVVGNPPWIAWENLSESYRDATSNLWELYQLHPPRSAMALPAGRSRSDMAVLMTYVAADKYLAPGGTLAFLITQSVFKSEAAGRGFRRFRLPDGQGLAVARVDDFTDFQPFEAASNRTAFIVLKHGTTTYPIPYFTWSPGPGLGRQPRQDIPVSQVRASARRHDWHATPVVQSDTGSPWLTGPLVEIAAIQRIVGESPYRALVREGANTRGANGIYWVERVAPGADGIVLVRSFTEGGRGTQTERQQRVEESRLFPLLRGRDVQPWRARPTLEIVLPYEQDQPGRPISPDDLARRFPYTHAYLEAFHSHLVARRPFRNFNPAGESIWELYNVGAYTFAPYKVVWREQATRFGAALAEQGMGRPIVPDHKVFSVGLEDLEESYYLLAMLNSTPVRVLVDSYSLDLSLSSHVLDYARIPRYSADNSRHRDLSLAGRRAHEAELPGALVAATDLIDELAAQLWDLTPEELAALREFDQLSPGST